MRRTTRWVVAGAALALLAPATAALAATHPMSTPHPTSTPVPFAHPGVLVDRGQLDLARQKVAAGTQPWKSAYAELRASSYASLSWHPHPRGSVDCGSNSNPDHGCTDERDDATAAYTDALVWYVSHDQRYAAKAIQILDAWPPVLKKHTNSNAKLQAGWAGATFARAAELVRYSGAGWSAAAATRFGTMLRTVFVPLLIGGAPGANGNWELIDIDALTGMAVYLDDHTTFGKALDLWRKRVPAYIYLKSDGPTPVPPPGSGHMSRSDLVSYWQGQSMFVDGLAQETCRDFGHTGWGLDAAVHAAETARVQGVDLYGEQATRLVAGFEFHAKYDLGAKPPSSLCHGKLHRGLGPVLEVAYNEFHNRLGMSLPNTAALLAKTRPQGTDGHFIAWETLTFAGAAGP
jgi:hypothetical protein